MPKQFLEAGKIVGTHGIRGDLKVQSWCDSPEVLCDFDTLYLDEKTPVTVEKAQVHKNIVLMHLAGVDTVEAAEDLVFIQDILGFAIFDRRLDREIGRLHDVITTNPAHDMYEVKTGEGRLVYIPAAKPFLQEIDMEQGVIYIESIEGLVE